MTLPRSIAPAGGAAPTGICSPAVADLVAAYDGHAYRLLVDLADHLGITLAYVDRPTVEAHLQRDLTDVEWAAVGGQFTAMSFDEHVGDHGTLRTDWIEQLLDRAGVPGRDRHRVGADGSIPDGEP